MTKGLTFSDFDPQCKWFKCENCQSFQRWKISRSGGILCIGCGTRYFVKDDLTEKRIEMMGKVMPIEERFRIFKAHVGHTWFNASLFCNYMEYGKSQGYQILRDWEKEGKIESI